MTSTEIRDLIAAERARLAAMQHEYRHGHVTGDDAVDLADDIRKTEAGITDLEGML